MSGTRTYWELEPELRARYADLIAERFGLRLTANQLITLEEAIGEKLQETAYDTPDELYRAFAAGWRPELLESLAARLTVGETHFMRVRPQIEALRNVVFPDLIGRRAATRRLRLWSAGCATGEEVYTLAILLHEQFPATEGWNINFLASDMSDQALETARAGLYRAWSFRDTPQEFRNRYFTPENGRWRLDERIRRMVYFTHLNLAADWFPSPTTSDMDLIV
jgi:chemotaxis protein methyltransferase CheR